MKRFLALIGVGALSVMVFAQDQTATKKKSGSTGSGGMAMPKPGPEMKDLRDLVGTWTSDEKYEASPMMPSGGTGGGTTTIRSGPGGFSIVMEVRSKNAMGSFAGHGVITWDQTAKAYKYSWVDSMTPGMVLETGHKQGENIVFTGDTMFMGKKIGIKDVISDRAPTSFNLTSFMNDGSGEKQVMSIKFTKQESSAAGKK